MLHWYDLIRGVTALVALTTMYILWRSYYLHHGEFSDRVMDYWWTLNMFLFIGFYASLEAIVRDRPPTTTLLVLLVASLLALRATRNGNLEETDQFHADERSIPRRLLKSLLVYVTRKR